MVWQVVRSRRPARPPRDDVDLILLGRRIAVPLARDAMDNHRTAAPPGGAQAPLASGHVMTVRATRIPAARSAAPWHVPPPCHEVRAQLGGVQRGARGMDPGAFHGQELFGVSPGASGPRLERRSAREHASALRRPRDDHERLRAIAESLAIRRRSMLIGKSRDLRCL